MRKLGQIVREEGGAVMVEAAIGMTLLLTLALGFVDFGYGLYQWNSASKAVQIGARLASVSPPISPSVTTAGPTTTPGDPVPVYPATGSYRFICVGGNATSCTGYIEANFSRIFRGDAANTNNDACADPPAGGRRGMCHFFPGLLRSNVQVTYISTGLGYQTRPGGAVPTVVVEIRPGLTFQFFFLGALLGFDDLDIPPMRSTVTGEDLADGAA